MYHQEDHSLLVAGPLIGALQAVEVPIHSFQMGGLFLGRCERKPQAFEEGDKIRRWVYNTGEHDLLLEPVEWLFAYSTQEASRAQVVHSRQSPVR